MFIHVAVNLISISILNGVNSILLFWGNIGPWRHLNKVINK